jgi:hypothetical protein
MVDVSSLTLTKMRQPASYAGPMTAEEPHATAIRRAFTTQAGAFEDPARNRLFTIDARWVFDALPVPGWRRASWPRSRGR